MLLSPRQKLQLLFMPTLLPCGCVAWLMILRVELFDVGRTLLDCSALLRVSVPPQEEDLAVGVSFSSF